MGLDVSFFEVEKECEDQELMTIAYEYYYNGCLDWEDFNRAEEIKEAVGLFEREEGSILKVFNMDAFVDHALPLKQNYFYKVIYSDGFGAGSYIGYGIWREILCQKVLGVDPMEVWINPEFYKNEPFYWLINFVDNEGIIAGEPFKKLKEDFKNHEIIFENEYYADKWRRWKKCVTESDGVRFH